MSELNPKTLMVASIENLNDKLLKDRLRVHRRQSKRGTPFNLLVLIDLAFIGLLFAFLFTRFVVLPGMEVNLIQTDLKVEPATSQIVVLTLENKETLFFNGGIFSLDSISSAFEKYIASAENHLDYTLIIRSDSLIDLESFLELCSKAEKVGFSKIQILGQERSQKNVFK